MGLEIDFSSVIAKFEELEKRAKQNMSKKALDKGSNIILEAQKITVSKDTGELEKALDKGKFKNGVNSSIEIGIESGNEDVTRYGYYQEYGNSNMLGKKWMKIAWNNSIQDASDAIKESIKEDLGL